MRSRVLVQFGRPIEIDAARIDAWKADERPQVRKLTDDIELSLRGLTINAPDWETMRVLDGVRRLYTNNAKLRLYQHAELTRRFLNSYEEFKDEPEVSKLFTDVKRFVEDLDALGLSERQLSQDPSFFGHAGKIIWHGMLLMIFAPLTLPGLAIHAPAFAMAVVAGDGLTKRRDVVATTKVMVTTLLVMLAYVVIALGLLLGLEPPTNYAASAGAAVLLPLSAWATIRVFKRQTVIRRYMWVLLNLFALRAELVRLRDQQEELTKRVWGMVDRLANSQIERILPPDDA
jgi:glycerol-3-phosphate O-acyltransferase/dihydroxyacetone phosphate acyltransferase